MSIEPNLTDTPASTPSVNSINVDEAEIESETHLSGGRKRKLTWLLDFDRIETSEGLVQVTCEYCKKKIKGATASGATHLENHAKSCPMKFMIPKEGPTLMNFKFDQSRSHLDLARMVIKHELPFSLVGDEFFHRFVCSLQPMFNFVSQDTLKSDIMKVYNEEKEKLYQYLDLLSCRFSITIDMWTVETQNVGYCCLTCHYIDDQWDLNKKIIGYKAVDGSNDVVTLSQVVLDLLYEWNFDRWMSSITVDDTLANVAMVRELRHTLSDRGCLALGGDLFHVHCSAHILNLIVQDGLHEITPLLNKIKETVKYVKLTPQKSQKFQQAKSQVKLQFLKDVAYDATTRWNSTYLMLESALPLKEAFTRLEQLDEDYKSNPSKEEWSKGEVICQCLKVFHNATKKISGTKYPTANAFFINVCSIYVKLLSWKNSPHDYVRPMEERMMTKFKKYWDECSLVLAVATVFYPKYKMEFIRFFYKDIYGCDADMMINKVRATVYDLYSEYVVDSISFKSSIGFVDNSRNTSSHFIEDNDDEFSSFESWYASRCNSSSCTQKSELDVYLEEPLAPRNKELNILRWWRFNPKFHILAKMARDLLAIPVSTIASEFAFSIGGRVLDQTRGCLAPEIVEALICAQDWLETPKTK